MKEKCLIVIPYLFIGTVGKNSNTLILFLNDPNAEIE
jgi:hypothetical protein